MSLLVNISAKAWMLPILGQMHGGVVGRQAPLLIATGASRGGFAASMEGLITLGLVERTPGHGHPLRPEFRLTERGQAAGALAYRVQMAAPRGGDLLRRAWTVPVLSALDGTGQFNQIKRAVPRITDRALSLSLKTLEDRAWVTRRILPDSRPPRACYQPIGVGAAVSGIVGPAVSR